MRTKFDGQCSFCGKTTKAGKGDFQSVGSLPKKIRQHHTGQNYTGKWLIRCFSCKHTGNETMKYKQLLNH